MIRKSKRRYESSKLFGYKTVKTLATHTCKTSASRYKTLPSITASVTLLWTLKGTYLVLEFVIVLLHTLTFENENT